MRPSRHWRFRLQDILDAISRIQSYSAGMRFDQFADDGLTQQAVERNLEIIGEAAANIPGNVTDRYPDVPWRKMRDMRNLVAHRYWGIELDVVWDTIQEDLPPLTHRIEQMLAESAE